ncbi:MAG: hypothetical protein ABSB67_09390 [Bryobacteraceae bacterium]
MGAPNRRTLAWLFGLGAFAGLVWAQQLAVQQVAVEQVTVPKDPFITNDGLVPTPAQYHGPLFMLSHDWPDHPLPPLKNPPWSQAIGGKPIDRQNAAAYVAALKQYVAPSARKLLLDPGWDAAAAHYYTEPWLGSIRESIHGTYAASTFGPDVFPGTGLKTAFDSHVLTYYDERAAYTLYKVWGRDGLNPAVDTENFKFAEGSVIVKAAVFVADDPQAQRDWWPVTRGAAQWPLYLAIPERRPGPAAVVYGYVMQFDIIVKDTVSAPKTGWVFSTLVYDPKASGSDAWEKMVPLGAMWGNDPEVNSALKHPPPLTETWINPDAPKYSRQTLGWGGRLSGPNDGARNNIQVGRKVMDNEPDSSCMSCHAPAQWQPAQHKMVSFLLPSFPNANQDPPYRTCPGGKPGDSYICSPAPGSADWMKWFQSRPGTEPQDPETGSVATDCDMVFAFKTLPMWWKAMGPPGQPMPFAIRQLLHGSPQPKQFNEYTGAPLKPIQANHPRSW